jgi:hypothetical protein
LNRTRLKVLPRGIHDRRSSRTVTCHPSIHPSTRLPVARSILPPQHHQHTHTQISIMDTLVHHLTPSSDFHPVSEDIENSDVDLASWGSSAGFGMLGKGGVVKGMQVPRVMDVSLVFLGFHVSSVLSTFFTELTFHTTLPHALSHPPTLSSANRFPITTHRLDVIQRISQNQARTRNNHSSIQIQRWCDRFSRFTCYCWKLYRFGNG